MTDLINRRKLIGIGAGALVVVPILGCNRPQEQPAAQADQPAQPVPCTASLGRSSVTSGTGFLRSPTPPRAW